MIFLYFLHRNYILRKARCKKKKDQVDGGSNCLVVMETDDLEKDFLDFPSKNLNNYQIFGLALEVGIELIISFWF